MNKFKAISIFASILSLALIGFFLVTMPSVPRSLSTENEAVDLSPFLVKSKNVAGLVQFLC